MSHFNPLTYLASGVGDTEKIIPVKDIVVKQVQYYQSDHKGILPEGVCTNMSKNGCGTQSKIPTL